MQITITQPQIEEAITNYVLSMLTLKPGQELTIDLRATRGDAGYTAEIAVGPAGRAPVSAPVARTAAVRNTGGPAAAAQTTAQAEAPEPETDDAPEPEGNVEGGSAEPAAEEAPAEEAESTGKRPSIFANMKAPKGRVGQETEAA